ncbi:MAG: hypothetical protein K2K82_09435 [Muribaculaceae bacterium]|nr:hypothetical protein [Muribaculaceae bacterium]
MGKKSISGNESDAVKKLCRRVEETAGITAKTPRHFEAIGEAVAQRTGVTLSPTTLKRIWGYLNEPIIPRTSTLDILAKFCGWTDYDHFMAGDSPEIESGTVGSKVLRVDSSLARDTCVRLMWPPSRLCVIKYLGSGKWSVVSSEGTRLCPGDTFRCVMIAEGEPLYLDDLEKQGVNVGVYVCARRSGIKFIVEE